MLILDIANLLPLLFIAIIIINYYYYCYYLLLLISIVFANLEFPYGDK